MLVVVLRLVCTAFYLQVTMCYQSCNFYGQIAYCPGQEHYWVPVLPPSITHLYLDSNYISEINSTSLRSYEELLELDLGNQKVVLVIRNDSFLRQRKLTRLVLGLNPGLKLEPRSFAGLSNLQNLFLDYCSLTESILAENYLEPLLSLEMLNLFGNRIERLRPGLFFSNLTKFTNLNLKLNQIDRLCEENLVGFRGKYFTLNIHSNQLFKTDFDWGSCGNPFKGMGFRLLDLSSNGVNLMRIRQFFRAINGTPIGHLVYSGLIGKDFSHDNFPDPDNNTFEGLENSYVTILQIPKNRIFALQSDVFKPLKDVLIIDISSNKINQINRNAFRGLQGHLKILNLSSNLLGEIYSDTFNSLTELVILDLSYNHIGVLGSKAFRGLPKLQNLHLTGNSLRDLGFPESLPNLNILFLGDNKLNSVTQISRFGMNSVYVDVSDNRLTNLEDIYEILSHFKHLQYLFYGGNFIRYCMVNQAKIPHNNSLQELDLHGVFLQLVWSQGQCLNLFDHLKKTRHLNISFNSLTTLPQGIFSGLSSIVEIDLSSNALTYLQADVFPVSLKKLHLSNNLLASPDPVTFQSLSFLSLSANRFHCNCTLVSFLNWLDMTNVTFMSPVEEYRCEFPAAVHNLSLLEYATIIEPCEGDDEEAVQALKFVLFIFSAILIIIVLLGGIIYARLRGHIFIIYKKIVGRVLEGPKPAPAEQNWQYDAFFCFSNCDHRWVEDALLKKLDNQFSEENLLRCCFEARDFLPGEDHLSNIRDAIWCSRKTLCIVSKEFLKDGWCLEAFALAHGRMLEELTNVLIMLVVGKVAHYQLMKCHAVRAFVQGREYLTWPEDPQDLEWFFERLVSQILKDTKVKKFVVDKPEPAKPECPLDKGDHIPLENIRAIVTETPPS
ncbi:toll-like receptor 5 [Melanotaenia boesemani]|uniref:toll-like receptor 5 n=1 Tax=Melanotaenia boesemani TaxID=1250792 RepID=UPI001C041AD8|nr:toll-like receptor 5 [Melanotaenia boesemani]XP_041832094.1 toll-like receptor 5 [Melanotaenia boesemani]